MEVSRLRLDTHLMTAVQILKLQVELHDGHAMGTIRTLSDLIRVLELGLTSSHSAVLDALTRAVSLMSDRQIVAFEVMGVDFSPLRAWAMSRQNQHSVG